MKFGMQLKTLEKNCSYWSEKKVQRTFTVEQRHNQPLLVFMLQCLKCGQLYGLLVFTLESLHVICHIVIETLSPHFLKTEHMINYNAV